MCSQDAFLKTSLGPYVTLCIDIVYIVKQKVYKNIFVLNYLVYCSLIVMLHLIVLHLVVSGSPLVDAVLTRKGI